MDGVRSLHFEATTIQSQMKLDDPDVLELDYTQAMMGFLLFAETPRTIEMIGLGGGSLAKYCFRRLPQAKITVVEISEDVIGLRETFDVPPDDFRFSVVHADGAEYVRDHRRSTDVLLVDGFDLGGQPPQLCSPGFYDHCHARLNDGGMMVINLCTSDPRYGVYARRIRESFDDRVVFVPAEDGCNQIAFASKAACFPPSRATLFERASALTRQFDFAPRRIAQRILHRLERRGKHFDARDNRPARRAWCQG